MEIYYKKDTLYVNVDEYLNSSSMSNIRKRVFSIIDDYDIENIVLNIIGNVENNELLDDFIREYKMKYDGNIKIR